MLHANFLIHPSQLPTASLGGCTSIDMTTQVQPVAPAKPSHGIIGDSSAVTAGRMAAARTVQRARTREVTNSEAKMDASA